MAGERDVKQILVVDDEESILTLIKYTFEDQKPDYHITTALDGFIAMDYLRQQRFDLILTDWQMAGMNGVELAETIRAISPDTQILLMTGSDVSGLDGRVESLFSGWIKKPFSLAHMINKIEQVMSQ